MLSLDVLSPNSNDKIALVIFGNVASGKSTFCKTILTMLPGYNYVCIDDIRKKWYHKHPEMEGFAREKKCEDECIDQILASRLLVWETSAASLLYKRMKLRVKVSFKTFYVYINCPRHECLHRFDRRKKAGHKLYLPNFRKKLSISELINHFHWIQVDLRRDLELDSDTLTPDEMVEAFLNYFKEK